MTGESVPLTMDVIRKAAQRMQEADTTRALDRVDNYLAFMDRIPADKKEHPAVVAMGSAIVCGLVVHPEEARRMREAVEVALSGRSGA